MVPIVFIVFFMMALAATAVAAAWRQRRRAVQAELRLGDVQRRHSALVEANGVGMWQVSPAGKTLYLNAAMCGLLEIERPEEVLGASYDRFFTPESVATIRRERARRDGGDVSSTS